MYFNQLCRSTFFGGYRGFGNQGLTTSIMSFVKTTERSCENCVGNLVKSFFQFSPVNVCCGTALSMTGWGYCWLDGWPAEGEIVDGKCDTLNCETFKLVLNDCWG